jgi:hypothetical protein
MMYIVMYSLIIYLNIYIKNFNFLPIYEKYSIILYNSLNYCKIKNKIDIQSSKFQISLYVFFCLIFLYNAFKCKNYFLLRVDGV